MNGLGSVQLEARVRTHDILAEKDMVTADDIV